MPRVPPPHAPPPLLLLPARVPQHTILFGHFFPAPLRACEAGESEDDPLDDEPEGSAEPADDTRDGLARRRASAEGGAFGGGGRRRTPCLEAGSRAFQWYASSLPGSDSHQLESSGSWDLVTRRYEFPRSIDRGASEAAAYLGKGTPQGGAFARDLEK